MPVRRAISPRWVSTVLMGSRSGLGLPRMLRQRSGQASLLCVAVSADASADQIEQALAAGFNDYWPKPIEMQPLLARLADLARDLTPTP